MVLSTTTEIALPLLPIQSERKVKHNSEAVGEHPVPVEVMLVCNMWVFSFCIFL
jgi:hypothetical protein